LRRESAQGLVFIQQKWKASKQSLPLEIIGMILERNSGKTISEFWMTDLRGMTATNLAFSLMMKYVKSQTTNLNLGTNRPD
jgi:hypothetical protein